MLKSLSFSTSLLIIPSQHLHECGTYWELVYNPQNRTVRDWGIYLRHGLQLSGCPATKHCVFCLNSEPLCEFLSRNFQSRVQSIPESSLKHCTLRDPLPEGSDRRSVSLLDHFTTLMLSLGFFKTISHNPLIGHEMNGTYQYVCIVRVNIVPWNLFSLLNFTCVCVCVWSGVMCVLGLGIKFISYSGLQ